MDLDSFLVSLYVLVDDWWKLNHAWRTPKTGRPALLSDPEVLTLAILVQWPRFRSERDFFRFAWAHLRPYFPKTADVQRVRLTGPPGGATVGPGNRLSVAHRCTPRSWPPSGSAARSRSWT